MSGTDQHQQIRRLIALVPYLNQHAEIALDRAAADFGTTPKNLVRDLQVLWMCGLPGLGPGDLMDIDMDAFETGGDGIIRLSNADYLDRPLRLNSAEAGALMLALRATRESSPAESQEVIDRVLAKLERAATDGTISDVVTPPPTAESVAPALRTAIDQGRQVRLGYYVATRDESTERIVDPLALQRVEQFDYLDAWCHTAEGRRTFRLDRIISAQVLDEPAVPHDISPRDLSESFFEPGQASIEAVVHLDRVARWVAEYYATQDRRELPDEGLEVTVRVGDPRWLVRLAMRLSPHARVISPPELVEQVRAAAATALAAYAEN